MVAVRWTYAVLVAAAFPGGCRTDNAIPDACAEDVDCYDGEVCNRGTGRCVARGEETAEGEGEGEGEGAAEGEGEGEGASEGEGEGPAEGEGEGPAEGEGEGPSEGEGEGAAEGEGEGEGEGEALDCAGESFEDGAGVARQEGQPCSRRGECPMGVVECAPATGQLRCSTFPGGSDDRSGPEVCDGLDNDCDGEEDDGLGPIPADEVRGECGGNVQVCTGAGGYQDSPDDYEPVSETCNGLDDDCDGGVDEGLGPIPADEVRGRCAGNVKVCNGAAGYQAAGNNYAPVAEFCNGLDDDCDGGVDEGLGPIPADEVRGRCAGNVKVCNGAAGYQAAGNNYAPVAEFCNGLDDDCDGGVDEGDPGGGGRCGTDVGRCQRGTEHCRNGEIVCEGSVGPRAEECDGVDDDCDGAVDVACGAPGDCHVVSDINGTGLDLEFCTVVPAGGSATFWLGCREDLNGAGWSCSSDEHVDADTPQHEVRFEHGFELLRTEVTEAQYRSCVQAGHPGCVAANLCDWGTPNYGEAGSEQHPIVCVSWAMAVAFSEWIGGRLPSEAEWEYGARGPMESADDYAVFPWGDDQIDCDHAAYSGCPGDEVDVGSFSPLGDSPFGLADMAGNVYEWAQDCYHDSYAGAPGDGRAWEGCGAGGDRVLRGGSWINAAEYCRSAYRYGSTPGYRDFVLGLRPARSLRP